MPRLLAIGATFWDLTSMKSTPTNGTAIMSTSVNDSRTLTHDMIRDELRAEFSVANVATLREYANECDRVGATALATELRGYAAIREDDLTDRVNLPAIDRVCDALLTGPGGAAVSDLHKGNPTDTRNAIMRALRVMFPYVPDTTLAERLAAAILSTSI